MTFFCKMSVLGALLGLVSLTPATMAHNSHTDGRDGFGRPLAAGPSPVEAPSWVAADHDGLAFGTDQADLTSLPTVHAVYLHPSDRASRFAELAYTFQGQARRQSRFLTQMSGHAVRFDERAAGGRDLLDITVIRSRSSDKALSGSRQFSLVKDDLRRAGLTKADKKYLVWVDAGSATACGQSDAPGDAVRSAANRAEGRTVSTIIRAYAPTTPDTGGFCAPILHELAHAMGAVLPIAPHYAGGHCNDNGNDYLCLRASTIPYDPDVGRYFDYNDDDYWDPAANPFTGSTGKLGWWTVNLSRFICPPATPFDPAAPAADCSAPNTPGY